jgi:aminotransferase
MRIEGAIMHRSSHGETEVKKKAHTRRISRRVSQVTISATKEMPMLAAKVGKCVSLGQGVPSFSTPNHVIEAVSRALAGDSRSGKYSLQPGMPELRRAAAEYLGTQKGIVVDPEGEIIITVGAMEGLLAAILTLVEQGDQVILPSPTYASYIEQVLLAEGTPVFVPLRQEDWGLDVEAIKRAITQKTRAIILCNPNNPTGGVFDNEEVRSLCRVVKEHDLILVSDETYDFLVYDDLPSPLSPAALPGLGDHVISVFSFSKKYAMTGWRVGYITAPHELMAQMMKVHDVAAICAPTPSQLAALAALEGPQDEVHRMQEELAKRRDLCCRRLDGLKNAFSYVKPRGAFYLMARYRFTDTPSRDVAIRILNEARVITVPGGSFGPGGEGHLRISFGATEEELNEAFDRIEKWVEEKAYAF